MLDNNQRAHDLAMAMINFAINNPEKITETQTAVDEGKSVVNLDIGSLYIRYYVGFLNEIERAFPSQHHGQ